MLLSIVKDCHGTGPCNTACFGPVSKVRIYNELSMGFLHVEGNIVVANASDEVNGNIYKISMGTNFSLYDARASKFICWNNKIKSTSSKTKTRHHRIRNNRKPTALVARKYNPKHLELCQFRDPVAKDFESTHVNLVASFNENLKVKFNKAGRISNKNCNSQSSFRHRRKNCAASSAFMILTGNNSSSGDPCGCPEARQIFCETELRNMLTKFCSTFNETYET